MTPTSLITAPTEPGNLSINDPKHPQSLYPSDSGKLHPQPFINEEKLMSVTSEIILVHEYM